MQVEQQSDSSSELETEVNQTTDESNKPGETEDSLLAVVQSVSAQADEQSTDAGDTDSPTEEQGQDTVTEQADGEQPEDFSKLPFNKHPRFRELVKEKNSYKTQVAEYEADAKQYREIQGFMQANGLTAEEVAQSLETLAKMKTGDPAKAYELMQERMEAMAVAAGKKLPAELEEKVEQGYIDRETAQELYQRQAEAERKAEMASTQLERQSQQDQQAQVHAMASAVAAWEQSTKATDPDFDLKAELVKDRVRAHVAQHGMPKTTDAALKMSKDAYDAVTQTLLRVRGDKTPMRTAVGGKTNGSAAPEPKSLLDVVRRASAGA
jgi:hypothetical protein